MTMTPDLQAKPKRLQSLDIVRGLTVAGMIVVNNGHTGSFQALRHEQWNGLSICDLVFPFFLFIMGISIYLSFSGRGFVLNGAMMRKIARRTLVLLLLGLFINWFDKAIDGNPACFDELRFWAVLQRIALCYFIVSVFALTVSHRYTLGTALGLLAVYTAIIVCGDGYAYDPDSNIIARVDRALFGYAHLYHKSPVDPEGLLGTVSATATVMLGFFCGMKIKTARTTADKTGELFYVGALMAVAGFIVSFALPVNKRIWSPSFVLVTAGLCALILAIVMKWTDIDRRRGLLTTFFTVFGVNALALYVASEFLAIVLGHFGVTDTVFAFIASAIPVPQLASLTYALLFLMLNFAIGYLLWRRRVFIKI